MLLRIREKKKQKVNLVKKKVNLCTKLHSYGPVNKLQLGPT
jgi:hypothetical protein